MPVVLGGASEILDVGHAERLVVPAIRKAHSLRDGGCVLPNCKASDAECQAHHVITWADGGDTSLGNLALLCPHHHAVVEPQRFNPPADRWSRSRSTPPPGSPRCTHRGGWRCSSDRRASSSLDGSRANVGVPAPPGETVRAHVEGWSMPTLHVDCSTCTARGAACEDCVISILLGPPGVELEDTEQRALTVLADAGLVPPLRLREGPESAVG